MTTFAEYLKPYRDKVAKLEAYEDKTYITAVNGVEKISRDTLHSTTVQSYRIAKLERLSVAL